MPRPASDKRQRLTEAAVRLVHTQGLERSTIAAIAAEAGVAAGSVYYYFKTKDDVARAVVDAQQEQWDHQATEWEELPSARERLVAYIEATVARTAQATAHGSAIAGLAADLRRSAPELADLAGQVLTAIVDWAATQFGELGYGAGAARARALHLVTCMEGAEVMAHALGDPDALEREAAHLRRWVENTKQLN